MLAKDRSSGCSARRGQVDRKTTWITKKIAATARARGSDAVIAASFTTAAAAELAGRDLPIPKRQIGTLHSLANRALDSGSRIVEEELEDWNKTHPQYALTLKPGMRANIDDGGLIDVGFGNTEGDDHMQRMDNLRARMVHDRSVWPESTRSFEKKWIEWKNANDLIDFTDMIELALENVPRAPGNPEVGFFDEVQDFTKLELALIRKWGSQMERIILAGDDDQCHPPGTPVLTTNRGYVPIEQLDPAVDRLVSYDRFGGGEVRGRAGRWGDPANGYEFQITSRPFNGMMVRLDVVGGGHEVNATPDHRLLVRWSEAARTKHAVYLMRRGDDWRIGLTQVLYDNGTFGPSMRCRQQGADCVWILATYDRRVDAMFAEETFAREAGITQMLFQTQGAKMVATQAELDAFHERLRPESSKRARELLDELGLLEAHPFWSRRDAQKIGTSRAFMVRAVNFINGLMELPVYDEGGPIKPRWQVGTHTRYRDVIGVWSLNVEPYHFYVSSGICLPNCLYRFKGATPDAFLDPPVPDVDKQVLEQSWRVPAAVHRVAEAWVHRLSRREPKLYLPREEEGSVDRSVLHYNDPDRVVRELIEPALEEGSVMVLATCSYLLDPVKHALRDAGVPFHNPFRMSRGDWNPLRPSRGTSSRDRLLAYLIMDEAMFGEASRLWTGGDVKRWSHIVRTTGVFVRGAKDRISGLPDRELTFQEVSSLFVSEEQLERATTPDVDWLAENLLAASRGPLEFPIRVVRQRGGRALMEDPRVVIGTIHSVKGGQADTVVLFPDLSTRAQEEWEAKAGTPSQQAESRDSVIRQMYVGMTRARQRLVVCAPGGHRFVPPELLVKGPQ